MSAGSTPPAPQQAPAFKPNYDILASMNSSRPVSQSPTPVMGASPQAQIATPPPADPFASLVSASPRASSSPFPPPAQTQPASSSLLDLVGGPAPQPPAAAAEDDEWNFASSLPATNALPSTNKIQVLNSQLRVDFAVRRVPGQPRQIHVVAIFSNNTSQSIGELHFQVAVEKVSLSPKNS
jgi:ADP-ribosylation factor-binding protein GGA